MSAGDRARMRSLVDVALALADQAGHAHHDEREQDPGDADRDDQVDVVAPYLLHDLDAGRDQRGAGQQREPQPGQPGLPVRSGCSSSRIDGCSAAAPQNR